MVQICPKKIQDGGRPPSLKIEKLQYLHNGSTDSEKILQGDVSCDEILSFVVLAVQEKTLSVSNQWMGQFLYLSRSRFPSVVFCLEPFCLVRLVMWQRLTAS